MSRKDRSILFSLLQPSAGGEATEGRGADFLSQFEGTVHSGREGTAGGHGRECGTCSIYTVSAVRDQKEKLSVQHLSPWKAQHTFGVGFPTSVKLCWRHSLRHTQICLHGDPNSSQADNEERVITTVEENSSSFWFFFLFWSLFPPLPS